MGDTEDLILLRATTFVMEELMNTSILLRYPALFHMQEEPQRNQNYVEVIIPNYSLEEFRSHFRMIRGCFAVLLEKIGNAKRIANIEKKLLFTVWMISKQESFLSAGHRFNFSKSSAHAAFCEILEVIGTFMEEYVKWPSRTQYEEIYQGFKEKSGGYILGIVSAIDGCHIQIKQPVANTTDYYNRKSTHSVILQGVCDHRTIFIDIYVGALGRLHDARVYMNSPLYEQLDTIVPADFHLVGDAAYPLLRNLITPFRDSGHLTDRQTHFNTRLSSARVTIERAFGLLKGRFRRLKYLDVANPIMANKIISACVILHNHITLYKDCDDSNGDDFTSGNFPQAEPSR